MNFFPGWPTSTNGQWSCRFAYFPVLKVPKREIFVTELIILSHPIWIGDLRTEAKNRFVGIVRLLFAILVFFR
jgi:hypothetical protein